MKVTSVPAASGPLKCIVIIDKCMHEVETRSVEPLECDCDWILQTGITAFSRNAHVYQVGCELQLWCPILESPVGIVPANGQRWHLKNSCCV